MPFANEKSDSLGGKCNQVAGNKIHVCKILKDNHLITHTKSDRKQNSESAELVFIHF